MKMKIAFLIIICGISFSSFGQVKKQIQFFGANVVQYMHPVQVTQNKYQPYFKNMGETPRQGKIVIDEAAKTFAIKWIDGESWECNLFTKEIKNENDKFLGDAVNTTYNGKWSDGTADCVLQISKNKSMGCIITLSSKKIIDSDYGIDTWKKIFTFSTGGKCGENQ